jgi:hypothetical protein
LGYGIKLPAQVDGHPEIFYDFDGTGDDNEQIGNLSHPLCP